MFIRRFKMHWQNEFYGIEGNKLWVFDDVDCAEGSYVSGLQVNAFKTNIYYEMFFFYFEFIHELAHEYRTDITRMVENHGWNLLIGNKWLPAIVVVLEYLYAVWV